MTLFKTLGVQHAHLLPSGLAAAVGTPPPFGSLFTGKGCTIHRHSPWLELLGVLPPGGGFVDVIDGVKTRKRS